MANRPLFAWALCGTLDIVYASDAAMEPRVKVLALVPPDAHPPIIYPAALVMQNGAANPDAARLLSDLQAQAQILAPKYGFTALVNAERKP